MINFIAAIIKIAVMLAFAGQLKILILIIAGNAAKAQRSLISYSKFTRMLMSDQIPRKKVQNH